MDNLIVFVCAVLLGILLRVVWVVVAVLLDAGRTAKARTVPEPNTLVRKRAELARQLAERDGEFWGAIEAESQERKAYGLAPGQPAGCWAHHPAKATDRGGVLGPLACTRKEGHAGFHVATMGAAFGAAYVWDDEAWWNPETRGWVTAEAP